MYETRLGRERSRAMNLLATARKLGCTVCAGSDSPVTPLSALLGIHSGVNHHASEERLSAEEMLRTYTSDAARLAFLEHECGTLAPGKLADLAVLDRPLDRTAPEAIKDISVIITVVGGEIRYERK
jgi:predicted amidohydrolase YtcJ